MPAKSVSETSLAACQISRCHNPQYCVLMHYKAVQHTHFYCLVSSGKHHKQIRSLITSQYRTDLQKVPRWFAISCRQRSCPRLAALRGTVAVQQGAVLLTRNFTHQKLTHPLTDTNWHCTLQRTVVCPTVLSIKIH